MEKDTISDGMSARKRADMIRASHQRLWWMELMRGIITCAFGFLFLTARSFAPRLFMYSLGAYLVIDGVLELYDVRSTPRHRLRPANGGRRIRAHRLGLRMDERLV